MKKKPSVFDDKSYKIGKYENRCSKDDIIYLDDESGRVKLDQNML